MANYNIKVENSTIDHSSCLIYNAPDSARTSRDEEMLQELQKLQRQIEETEPMIADALSNLEKAIRSQDKPSTSKFIRQLSSGVTASFLANIASASLLRFLGIG